MKKLLALLIVLLAKSSLACTKGTDCFCDCITDTGGAAGTFKAGCSPNYPRGGGSAAAIQYCEDWDNLSWDQPSGANFRAAGYDNNVCNPFEEGPGDVNNCYNFVQDNNCDSNATNTTTDCAIGNQSLGQKYDTAKHHDIFARKSFPSRLTTLGYTAVIKYSAGFYHADQFKNDEFDNNTYTTRGAPLGQDTFLSCDSYDQKKTTCGPSPSDSAEHANNLACTHSDRAWSTRLFTFKHSLCSGGSNSGGLCTDNSQCPGGTCAAPPTVGCSWVNTASVTKGALACNGAEWGWSPCISDFPGGTFSWPTDQWACTTTKISGMGTASMRVQQTWTNATGGSATVVDFTMDDTAGGQCSGESCEFSSAVDAIKYNNYDNGGSGVGSGYCTNGAGAGLGCDRGYRYEDNIIVTNGDPVPCSVAMAEIIGASDTWVISPFTIINPSTCVFGNCAPKGDLNASAAGTATGTITWLMDSDCDNSNGFNGVDPDTVAGSGGTLCANSSSCLRQDVCDFSAKAAGTYTVEVRSTRGAITGTATTTFQVQAPTSGPGNNPSGRYTITDLWHLFDDPSVTLVALR